MLCSSEINFPAGVLRNCATFEAGITQYLYVTEPTTSLESIIPYMAGLSQSNPCGCFMVSGLSGILSSFLPLSSITLLIMIGLETAVFSSGDYRCSIVSPKIPERYLNMIKSPASHDANFFLSPGFR